jgi:GDSL-like Lipase/Acylhydrolase family
MEVALLGDSLFDNGAYVQEGYDVFAHLREILPAENGLQLLASDGAVVDSVLTQLASVQANTTHLVISAGGNDALKTMDLLASRVSTVAEALDQLSAAADQFRQRYERMLKAVVESGRTAAVCTIYNPRYDAPALQRRAVAALAHFNDVILLAASKGGIPILDLRQVCTVSADYANWIEPSDVGGRRIAVAIANLLAKHDFATSVSQIYR